MNTSAKIRGLLLVICLLFVASRMEALTIYAVDASNNLLRFNSATPGTIQATIPITGLQPSETIEGIDFGPASGQLYALGKTGSAGRLYILNTTTGAAAHIGLPGTFTLTGTIFGFDFDPVANRIRVVSNAEQNIVIHPFTGTVEATDGALAYAAGDPNNAANPTIVAAAYSNSALGATSTTLYDLDAGLDILVTQDPPASGQLATKGPLGLNTASVVGFDIASASGGNTGYATLRVNNVVGLYTISLTSGAATLVGAVGGNPNLVDMTVSLEPQTFVVNNTHDLTSGVCNSSNCYLRDAINAANAKPGLDVIAFNIAGSGVKTFTLLSALPVIFDPVIIDGYTQPGASVNTLATGNNAVLLIELNGASAGNVSGLTIRASGSEVRGLVINRFLGAGVTIGTPTGTNAARANQVTGNFIGTDTNGSLDLGNGTGVSISAPGNVVGGLFPSRRNLISGNTNGVHVTNIMGNNVLLSHDNLIIGNYIGTDKSGTAALGNSANGVFVLSHDNEIGRTEPGGGNLISGNLGNGIELQGAGAANNLVLGNLIGTNATGNGDLGNAKDGVRINGAPNNIVGGAAPGARNVISGNEDQGVYILFSGAAGNRVLGNFIGTNAAGEAGLSNDNGVAISAPANFVGGAVPGEGNLISGNTFYGVVLNDTSATDNRVEGNRIGTDVAGGPLSNQYGVYLVNGANNTTIGGSGGAANTIAFNTFGVLLNSSAGTGNAIIGNSTFSNNGLGIDLLGANQSFGVTANDSLDQDSGPNNLQNYPVLTGITGFGNSATVQGQLHSSANTAFVIDFYGNNAVDPSGFGEGRNYLGFVNVQTDAQGNATFSFPLGSGAAGQFITATATDAAFNTSEFSMASAAVPGSPPPPTPTPTPGLVANVSTRLPVGTGDNVLIEGFIVQGPNGSTKKIMVRAIGPSLAAFGIPDALGNPTLEIRDGSNAVVATNDDWGTTQVGGIITGDQSGEISGSGLAPGNSLESAIIADLAPGSYTAVVRGLGETVGTGLVDAYDLSPASPARLANIATRGLIQPGDQLMIAGFIIQSGDVRAVIRAIGPSLSAFGITNALPDTTLQLRDQNGAIVRENDDWESDQKAELEATGLQPGDSREAALVVTLPPGQYTAQVRGKPETTGLGVVENYFLQ